MDSPLRAGRARALCHSVHVLLLRIQCHSSQMSLSPLLLVACTRHRRKSESSLSCIHPISACTSINPFTNHIPSDSHSTPSFFGHSLRSVARSVSDRHRRRRRRIGERTVRVRQTQTTTNRCMLRSLWLQVLSASQSLHFTLCLHHATFRAPC